MDGHKMFRWICSGIALLALTTTARAQDAEHNLAPAIRIAKQSMKTAEELQDYSADFFKREVVGGQTIVHSMAVKMRHEPFSVYLRFHKPHDGREVIYVEGQNNGNLLAHETGIKSVVGTVSLSPNSKEALSESKHPITEMGIANLVKQLIKQWEFESKYGESEVKYYPNAKLGDRQWTTGSTRGRVHLLERPNEHRFNEHRLQHTESQLRFLSLTISERVVEESWILR
jgi:hypothetical protein